MVVEQILYAFRTRVIVDILLYSNFTLFIIRKSQCMGNVTYICFEMMHLKEESPMNVQPYFMLHFQLCQFCSWHYKRRIA